MQDFAISIVIPVYNTEEYLEETINSVLAQTIGFEDSVQLILVNDGSVDNSDAICRRYQELYPDNIEYYPLQSNRGVSFARNLGLEKARGELVSFLDSDDKWPQDAFEKIYGFYKKHCEEIDVISCRMKYFGDSDKFFKAVDKKFENGKDRVVDLSVEYYAIHHSVSSSFIKTDSAKKIRFDTNVHFGEDSKFLNTIILNKMKYGIMSSVIYMYRKRNTGSLTKTRLYDSNYYSSIDDAVGYFIDLSFSMYNEVVPYVQYLVAGKVGGRLRDGIMKSDADEEILSRYKERLCHYLQYIDDHIIMEIINISQAHKLFALSLKYEDFYERISVNESELTFNGEVLYSTNKADLLKVNLMKTGDRFLHIYGQFVPALPKNDYELYFKDEEGNKYPCRYDIADKEVYSLGERVVLPRSFSVEIPAGKEAVINCYLDYKGTVFRLKIKHDKWSVLNSKYKKAYYSKDGYILRRKGTGISIRRMPLWKAEGAFEKELFAKGEYKAAFFRMSVLLLKLLFGRRRTRKWLVSDAYISNHDNIYSLIQYLSTRKNSRISLYLIDAYGKGKTDDHPIYLKAIYPGSLKYEYVYLLSDVFLCGLSDDVVPQCYGYCRDLMPERVFFQDKYLCEDESFDYNIRKLNVDKYFVSNTDEQLNMKAWRYGYPEENIVCIGVPRDDMLFATERNHEGNDNTDGHACERIIAYLQK